jgi:hypothetical protein
MPQTRLDLYSRWITRWEHRLAARDSNRVERPFEWGEQWLLGASANGDGPQRLARFVAAALADSDSFFSYQTPLNFRLKGRVLTFTSPLATPYPENNLVHADFFPAAFDRTRAVLVLPQWNAGADGHHGLCRMPNLYGVNALRMSMAYHDRRMPPELERADYHVSSNVGRTIHAARQSVIDARACLDWLQERGFRRLAILGTSLGSCIGFIAAAHDPRIQTGVFNHVSMYFSDVVWTGLATRHVRRGFGSEVSQDELREYWRVISPAAYLDRLVGRDLKSLLIWAKRDSSFLPEYSRQVVEFFRIHDLPHEEFVLPCGHYTTGRFPFNLMDGLAMCHFLDRNM